MQCQACGRLFETYNRICPYCRTKNPETPQEPIANGIADRERSPSVPPATSPPAERPRPKVFIPTDRPDESPGPAVPSPRPVPITAPEYSSATRPGSTDGRSPARRPFPIRVLKGVFACGLFLLVVLVAWAALVSVPGLFPLTLTLGTAPAPAASDIPHATIAAIATTPTIATAAPTRVADTPGPSSPDPDATRYVAPGYRITSGTPAVAPTRSSGGSIVGGVTPSPTDTVAGPNWTGDEMRYVGYFYPHLSTVEEHVREMLASSLGDEWSGIRNGSEELERTTAEGISKILSVPVSPDLSDVKNQSLGILDRLASESDRSGAPADAHGRGNGTAAGSLIVAGAEEIIEATGDLERIGEYLPKELALPK